MRLRVCVLLFGVLALACSEQRAEPTTQQEPVPVPDDEADSTGLAAVPPEQASASPTVVDAAAPPRQTSTFRIATYNILAAKRGVADVAKVLLDLDADIIALQEVDRNTRRFGRVDLVAEFANALGLQSAFARYRRYQGGEIGVALLSRFPVLESRRISAPTSKLGMLLTTLQAPEGPLRVLVVHFHPTDPRDPKRSRNRMDQLRLQEAKHALETAVAQTKPTVVLGDFNARPNGPEYALFSAALSDACPGGARTWPTPFPLVRLDYVWLSSEFEAVQCSQFASTASDHNPVVVDVAVRRLDASMSLGPVGE